MKKRFLKTQPSVSIIFWVFKMRILFKTLRFPKPYLAKSARAIPSGPWWVRIFTCKFDKNWRVNDFLGMSSSRLQLPAKQQNCFYVDISYEISSSGETSPNLTLNLTIILTIHGLAEIDFFFSSLLRTNSLSIVKKCMPCIGGPSSINNSFWLFWPAQAR